MKEGKMWRSAVVLAVVLMTLAIAAAGSAKDIKERMRERLAEVVALKAAGIVGENNRGYLEFVSDQRQKVELVMEENQDRQEVYKAIAKQQGTTVDLVAERRAKQIADNALRGEWLQDSQGKWYQK